MRRVHEMATLGSYQLQIESIGRVGANVGYLTWHGLAHVAKDFRHREPDRHAGVVYLLSRFI